MNVDTGPIMIDSDMTRRTAPTPWTLPQMLFTLGSFGFGLIVVLVGWFGASGETTPNSQVPWVALAAFGTGIAGVGSALWLLHGRRAVGVYRRALIQSPRERQVAATVVDTLAAFDPGDATGGRLVAGPNMTRYHAPGCPLVAGKAVCPSTLAEHTRRGRRPCGVCQPRAT